MNCQQRIANRCPACGNQTLFIAEGGWLTCSWLKCPAPCAIGDLADDHRLKAAACPPVSPVPQLAYGGPIPLTEDQEKTIQAWAADDRLWTTQETVEFNLQTFARTILKLAASPAPSPAQEPTE